MWHWKFDGHLSWGSKCSKISNTISLRKGAQTNSADPDQTASEEAAW